jgi:hypothetical protein
LKKKHTHTHKNTKTKKKKTKNVEEGLELRRKGEKKTRKKGLEELKVII